MSWKNEVLIEILLTFGPILIPCVIGAGVWIFRKWRAWRRLWKTAWTEAMDAEWEEVVYR